MKLYYSAGSCSTSCHITLEESGLKHEAIEIDWDNPADPNLGVIQKYNPDLGTLPILVLDNGKALAQNVAIHTYVAELAPEKKLLPPPSTLERAEAMDWLSFVSSDLHKAYSPLFAAKRYSQDPARQAEFREFALQGVKAALSHLNKGLAGKDYLLGKQFTVIDSYAFVVAGWSNWLEIPLDQYTNVKAYLARVSERPAVKKVLKLEGLLD
jgi:glutathione S-transferase